MVDWRRGGGVCLHWYLRLLLYVKLNQCSGSSIDLWLIGGGVGSVCTGICAFFYMSNLFGVVVFHRSMVDWRRGWGLSALVSVHSTICETQSV